MRSASEPRSCPSFVTRMSFRLQARSWRNGFPAGFQPAVNARVNRRQREPEKQEKCGLKFDLASHGCVEPPWEPGQGRGNERIPPSTLRGDRFLQRPFYLFMAPLPPHAWISTRVRRFLLPQGGFFSSAPTRFPFDRRSIVCYTEEVTFISCQEPGTAAVRPEEPDRVPPEEWADDDAMGRKVMTRRSKK